MVINISRVVERKGSPHSPTDPTVDHCQQETLPSCAALLCECMCAVPIMLPEMETSSSEDQTAGSCTSKLHCCIVPACGSTVMPHWLDPWATGIALHQADAMVGHVVGMDYEPS